MMSDVLLRDVFQCFGKLEWVHVSGIPWPEGLGL